MTKIKKEEYFPRGGKKTEETFQRGAFAFEKRKKPKKAKERIQRREKLKLKEKEIEDDQISESVFDNVKAVPRGGYQMISEGMKLLCAVNKLLPSGILLNLPGRLLATVPLSKTGGKQTVETGQIVSCSVVSISQDNSKFRVEATLDPREVNSDLSAGSVSIGDKVQVSVESIEDHGYLLSCGIQGTICFLSQEKAKSYLESRGRNKLEVGQILWAKIIARQPRGSQNRLTVTIDPSEVKDHSNSDRFWPGVMVNVTVEKILPNGLGVYVPNSDITGFIDISHFHGDWMKPNNFELGQKFDAIVLYKLPFTETYFFSLKVVKEFYVKSPLLGKEKLKNATVFDLTRSHIILKVPHEQRDLKGFLSLAEYRAHHGSDEDLAPVRGSTLNVYVEHYDYMEGVYICSVKDSGRSGEALKLGDVIQFTVKSQSSNGITGRLKEFKVIVPSQELPRSMGKKELAKQEMEGRILCINERQKVLTVSLKNISSKNSGKSSKLLSQLKLGDHLSGKVKSISSGWAEIELPDKSCVKIVIPNYCKEDYTLNMRVEVYVSGLTKEMQPNFSLQKCVFNNRDHSLTVAQQLPDGIVVDVEDTRALVYDTHLSDNNFLCPLIKRNLQPGKKIQGAVWCGAVNGTPMFSLKGSYRRFVKENFGKNLKSLHGRVVPTSLTYSQGKPELNLPIRTPNSCCFVKSPISENAIRECRKKKGTTIYARISVQDNEVIVDPNLSDVKITVKESLYLILDYLEEARNLKLTAEKGSIHEVTIDKILPHCALVRTKGGGKGSLMIDEPRNDGEFDAYLLFQDPVSNKMYFYSGNPPLDFTNKDKAFLKTGQRVHGRVIGKAVSFFIFLICKGKCKGKCVYVPVYLHPNVQIPCFSWKDPMTCVEVILIEEEYILGVFVEQKDLYVDSDGFVVIPRNKLMSSSEDEDTTKDQKTLARSNSSLTKESKRLKKEIDEGTSVMSKSSQINENKPKTANQVKTERINTKQEETTDDSSSSEAEFDETLHPLPKICPRSTNPVEPPSCQVYPSLEEAAQFDWTATSTDLSKAVSNIKEEIFDDSSDDETKQIKTKLTPAQKRKKIEDKEKEISKMEEEMLKIEENPQTAEHFERLVAASPNNSKIWVQYMAFHLQSTEIEKARSIAGRAIKTINVRLEDEKLNVWTALLNLENLYGTSDEFQRVLREAVKYNDEYSVLTKVLDIYVSGKKQTELESLVSTILRKHRDRPKCWITCLSALMSAELFDKARLLLQRCLKEVPVKSHIPILSQFALLENKHGNEDEAQAILESIVTSYPARVDIWSVYVDMLVKREQIPLARQVLSRAVRHNLPVKKLKTLFMKWLSFEEKYGTEEDVSHVKEAAYNCVKKGSTDESL